MSVQFINWLYSLEPPSQSSVIIFPRIFNRWNIITILVSEMDKYNIVIVSNYIEKFKEIQDTNWKDLELTRFPLISYNNIEQLNQFMNNPDIDFIIIDDVNEFSLISSRITSNVETKVVFLSTFGDDINNIIMLNNKYKNLSLLLFNVSNDKYFDWKIINVDMSPKQQYYYDRLTNVEIEKNIKDHQLTSKVSLYIYPVNILSNTLIKNNSKDVILDSTWMNCETINNLNTDGNKLLALLDSIVSNWPSKQIVISNFSEYYGVDLIVSFLKLLIKDKQNPYESSEILSMTDKNNKEDIFDTQNKYNMLKTGVLVTNIVPTIPLDGTTVVHIPDSYNFILFRDILDHINRSNTDKLMIYIYLANKSVDTILYQHFEEELRKAMKAFTGLKSLAKSIAFNDNLGLVITN